MEKNVRIKGLNILRQKKDLVEVQKRNVKAGVPMELVHNLVKNVVKELIQEVELAITCLQMVKNIVKKLIQLGKRIKRRVMLPLKILRLHLVMLVVQ